jgi:hypothetical protein
VQPGHHVHDRDAHLVRLATRLSRDRHQPSHRLREEVVPSHVAEPETGDPARHDVGAPARERVVVEAA